MTVNSQSNTSLLRLRVHPNASRNEIAGFIEGVLQVKVAAPPVRGKANRQLINFLSKSLGIRKSAIKIVNGDTSRHKIIAIDGLSQTEIINRLSV